jgi:hypothetical protein
MVPKLALNNDITMLLDSKYTWLCESYVCSNLSVMQIGGWIQSYAYILC